MGSDDYRQYSGCKSTWGWGKFIEDSGLKILKSISLPSSWTLDEKKKQHICFHFLKVEYCSFYFDKMGLEENMKLMKTLDDAWNSQDWKTLNEPCGRCSCAMALSTANLWNRRTSQRRRILF